MEIDEMEINELKFRISILENEVNELKEAVRILKQTHSFDMGRVFDEIDKMKTN